MPQPLQPFLHDLLTLLAAPTQVLSAADGQVGVPAARASAEETDRASAEGVLHADVRLLSRVVVTVDGRSGEHVATRSGDGGRGAQATFTSLLRHVGADLGAAPDPPVRLDRVRTVTPGDVGERLRLGSVLPGPVTVEVAVTFAGDGAPIEAVKAGRPATPAAFPDDPVDDVLRWDRGDVSATLTARDAALTLSGDRTLVTARWRVELPARGAVEVGWRLAVQDAGAVVVAAPAAPPLSATGLLGAGGHRAGEDSRLRPWLERSLADLDGLRMSRPESPEDVFFAAGAPWYLTLFGRDSLWAARLLLPVDLAPARGTLRTLAALQGGVRDDERAEQPGKIMHELRRASFALGVMRLPALYYGTIDATPLWVCLLHDAWRAGLPEADVRALLPHLERALDWLRTDFDADGDGFGEYLDRSGQGLANQGWKDSADSVRFADGSIATGPVALCEVQGYAHEAAVGGAALLDAFGRPGGEELRGWAADLATAFRARFWCGEDEQRYPALALDGSGRRVDALTSNIGHLLGTGLLDAEEERCVARHLAGPALDSGLGLRTMSAEDGGYSPLSYHCGSVWPHDTAIAVAGLHRAGLAEHASGLVEGLLRASVAFDQRLPELWSGEGAAVPYPASCRPQAWSAAAAVVVAGVLAPEPPAPDQPR